MKKLLVLVNWNVYKVDSKNLQELQSPNILGNNKQYWFFKYWPEEVKVDVVDYSKIPIFHTFEKKLLRFYVTQCLRILPRLHKYDAILSHGAQSAVFLAILRSIFHRMQPPHIIIDVGCLNGGRSRQPELVLFQIAMRSVSGLIYHASTQQRHYERYFPLLAKRAYFVPLGVDIEFFKPSNVKQEDYILSIGYRFRDWETLINAYSQIKTNTVLKIVGPDNLNVEMPENVYVQSYVPINSLIKLIAKARFIVLPLVNLPYAHGQMTLLQSMAMAKAVIVTKVPATEDYIINGEDAIFVKLHDVRDMKNKIEFLLNNQEEVERIGKNARKSIETKFTERHMAEGIYKACKLIGAL